MQNGQPFPRESASVTMEPGPHRYALSPLFRDDFSAVCRIDGESPAAG